MLGKLEICDSQNLAKLGMDGQLIRSDAAFCQFALWFRDVSFFFDARAEFRCLISLGESVPCVSSSGSFAPQLGRVSPIVNIFHCKMNKHVQPSINLFYLFIHHDIQT